MGNTEKFIQILIEPRRWTLGVAWEFSSYSPPLVCGIVPEILWRCEVSIQIPVIAVSVLLGRRKI